MGKGRVGFYILLIFACNVDATFRYDYAYSRFAKGWLKLHHVPATFNDAFLRCDLEGAVLASPSDEGLLEAFKLKHPKVGLQSGILTGIYTGIHATISRGDYTTIEGIPLARIPVEWAPGEPQDYDEDEGCLIMLDNGTLAGVKCNETYPYLCFKKKTLNMVINECGTVDQDYHLEKRTGSCYKFHKSGKSWRQAHSVCLAEGGHLAIINGDTEAQVIKELFEKYPEESLGLKYKDTASIGFLDWGKRGMWYTVHGEKLEVAGYKNWGEGQPDNGTNDVHGENCGAVFRNAQLNDVPCDSLAFTFICEKEPNSLAADDDINF